MIPGSAPAPSVRAAVVDRLGFVPDAFQVRAFDALDAGQSVLVSAPTGSGKTAVADYAIARALAEGRKAFYTTPLKALSNQKFAELAATYGHDRIGLLTGDVSHRPDAQVVVMTTEVVRNMMFARSPQLVGLGLLVLDEVHYLQDPYRGSVWEEAIILAPDRRRPRLPVGHGVERGPSRGLAPCGPRSHRGDRRDAPAGETE